MTSRIEDRSTVHKVAIIGSGPAGHTAAIYTSRANLEPIMFEGLMAAGVSAGGQLTTTTDVENFPGFPGGIMGPVLMDRLREQSASFGTEIITDTVSKVDLSARPFKIWPEYDENQEPILAETVIIATGATAKRLNIPGEDTLWMNGISACAVCDGALPLFRNQPLAVVGGGDSAVEEALFLTKYASKVYVLVRRDALRASKIMADRLAAHPKVEIMWNSAAESAHGEGTLKSITVVSTINPEEKSTLEVAGLFYAIGHIPNTAFLEGQLPVDSDGYLLVTPGSTTTSIPGVFACGDVADKKYRQAITAAGTGCMAALEAERFLEANTSH
ncbi:thioredoxin reductase [Fonticula alba]|uniref:Thioredoxin reductase n=1 Tax=Fonticula alba TaxID=691883 RepID=A0A058ZD95_FONAL|nr:thioredoxin reductase [Fonticula alba]KCV71903.1 thioredoxin reductase [Fonticula alba]|eukprot:XP_009493481.1 thioredoxin reductase [Fonticula alba]